MDIIFNSKKLDPTKEHELITKSEFGFKVSIKYTDASWYENKELVLNNCTEVHHLWSLDYMGGKSIAFESDIHCTGFTRRIDDIVSVTIELSTELYDSYFCVIGKL